MFARPGNHKNWKWAANRGTTSSGQRELSLQPLKPRTVTEGGVKEGRTGSQGARYREIDPDGSTALLQDSKEESSHGNGGHILTAIRDGREAGKEEPQEHIPWTGNPACCPEEALIWLQSGPPPSRHGEW